MSTFLYTSIRTDKRSDPYSQYLVRVWRMTKGGPLLIASACRTHMSPWQIVMEILRDYHQVPKSMSMNSIGLPRREELAQRKIQVHCLTEDTAGTIREASRG